MPMEAASIIPVFILRERKRLDLRRNQAFSKYLVEISGIEPLTS